jgi:diguanylate cyclase (GGDEF)-like protein/PAS domain S-box-containing protein
LTTSLRGHVRLFRYLRDAVLLAVAYYLLARVGLSLGSLPGNVAPVWPPGGFALAVLLVRGRRLWPGVAIGTLAVYGVGADIPLLSAMAISAGNTLAAVGAATVLGRIGFRPVFDRTRDVAALVAVAAGLGSAVSATIGTLSLHYGGLLPAADYLTTWRTWWMGDGLGVVVMAPALLAVFGAPLRDRRPPGLQFAAFLAVVAITGFLVIGPAGYPYLALPLVVWGAVRWALPGASLATLATAVVVVVRVGQGAAPFAGSPMELLRLDGFLAVVSFSGLVVAAVVIERDAAAGRLEAANRELEERVRIRTAALDADRERLAEAQRIAGIGSWELDLVTETANWSDEQYRIFGVDPSTFEPTYDAFLALVHPDDRAAVIAGLERAVLGHEAFLFDYRVPLSDGGIRWVRARGRLITDDAGDLVGMQGTCQDITDRMEAEAALTYHALHDPLTGLPNRTLLLDRIEVALARSSRLRRSVAVLFLDLDRFKPINDSRGHATGDTVLQTVASRLRAAVRPSDTVGRLGGDEFVVVSEDASVWQATVLGERLIRALEKPFEVEGDEVFVTVSVGIAIAETAVSADELLRDADVAMYQAKQRGRARCEFFDEAMRTEAARRLETATALHRALERDEFETHYQPIVDLNSGAIVGVEALVRWCHPERGLVSPAAFIPMAEEQGLIVPIGDRVLEESCRQWASWRTQFPDREPLILNINISARQLHRPEFLQSIRAALARHGVDPGSICLELTESVLMEDVEAERHTLSALRELGVGLAIDDFGTGYSSLTYLKRFPVTGIKIDQTFVAGLGGDSFDTAIIESVIELAHAVGLHVTAEGIETVEQMLRLRALGCDYAQGYYFARPQSAANLDALFEYWGQAEAYTGS